MGSLDDADLGGNDAGVLKEMNLIPMRFARRTSFRSTSRRASSLAAIVFTLML